MLPALPEYEHWIYTLPERYPSIRQSTLVIIRHGPAFAELVGTVEFESAISLKVWEDLDFSRRTIRGYSYAVSRHGERLYWYDPQHTSSYGGTYRGTTSDSPSKCASAPRSGMGTSRLPVSTSVRPTRKR